MNKCIDFDDDDLCRTRRRKNGIDESSEKQTTPENIRPLANNHKNSVNNISSTNKKNKSTGKSNAKRNGKSGSNTPTVKFARYFEEIVEETKFIDIEGGSNKPIEETRQNKKLREIIEILDSDEEA